jgi:hypothetical protein
VQNFTSSAPFEFSSIAALNRVSVTDGWTIILCCCAASNARSSADLSLKAEWGFGSGLARLLRKLAINEISPLMDRSRSCDPQPAHMLATKPGDPTAVRTCPAGLDRGWTASWNKPLFKRLLDEEAPGRSYIFNYYLVGFQAILGRFLERAVGHLRRLANLMNILALVWELELEVCCVSLLICTMRVELVPACCRRNAATMTDRAWDIYPHCCVRKSKYRSDVSRPRILGWAADGCWWEGSCGGNAATI